MEAARRGSSVAAPPGRGLIAGSLSGGRANSTYQKPGFAVEMS